VKRRSKGDAGADGGFDGSGIAFRGDPHSYERRRTYGPVPRRRVGMHGAAMVRIPNPFAKSEATPPRPFLDLCTATRFPRAGRRARLLLRQPFSHSSPTLLRRAGWRRWPLGMPRSPSSSAERGATALPAGSTKESRQCQAKKPRRRPGIQRRNRRRRKIFEPTAIFALDPRTARFLAVRG
jgi:hypothetical protein